MTIYNIQILTDNGWATGYLGRMRCSLSDLLSALIEAMPHRKLRVWAQGSGVTRIAVY